LESFAKRRTWGPTPRYPKVEEYKPPQNQKFIVIAGPCSVESEEQIKHIAKVVASLGATHLRGGLFRAGTYPGQNFGYVETKLFRAFAEAAASNGLKTIIEVLDYSPTNLSMVNEYADCFQIGCRSMQNYSLLRKVGAYGKQTFLKRHPGTTIDEFLGAAEHLLTSCAFVDPVLIERGSSGNSTHVRWDLSISMIPAVQEITDIPILVDASHGTGRRDLVEPMTLAGVAAGANGILVETHTDPEKSLSDADQAVSLDTFMSIMNNVNAIRNALTRKEIPPWSNLQPT
jgi:3-deoxy-7-phosphoheptulonate synthase